MPDTKLKERPDLTLTSGSREVKKHNNAIHVSGELSLIERKLVNVLLLNAYDNLTTVRKHTIAVPILCELVGWEKSGNVNGLKKALKALASTPIEFDLFNREGKPSWDTSAIVAHANIENGMCTYQYSDFLAEKLANPEMYSIINVGVQRDFKGNYSLSLYENCLRFRGTESGSTGWWPIATWRKVLGADAALYDEFKFLSGKVIKPACAEINKVSDLIVEPEYKREGRFVTEIRFIVRENPQRSLLDINADVSGARDTEAYKILIELGVGASLALSMVQKDEKRALEIAQYTKARYDNGEIKGSAGGYVRKLVKENANVAPPKPAAKPAAKSAARPKVDSAEQENLAKRDHIRTLPADVRARMAADAIEKGFISGKSFNPKTGKFSDTLERLAFSAWLSQNSLFKEEAEQ